LTRLYKISYVHSLQIIRLIATAHVETILEKMRGSKMEASPLFDGIREKWIEEGEAKGKIEGKTEGKKEMAKKLLSRGVAVDVIVEASGLTAAEVEDLKKELEH